MTAKVQGHRKGAMPGVSVAVITCNEERRLSACLRSASFAGEIVVLDSGSTDKTVEIATSMGARVFEESWRGFSGQKQLAVELCSNHWVLILDADERVPPETARAIREALSSREEAVAAFSFPRKNVFHGRWIRHCGWWPDRIVRLVDRRRGSFDGRAVHERWVTGGREIPLDAPLEHHSFQCYSDLVTKMERYSDLTARAMYEAGGNASPWTPPLHALWMFFRAYVLERGALDGLDGLVISLMNAGGSFFKYAKLRELVQDQAGCNRLRPE